MISTRRSGASAPGSAPPDGGLLLLLDGGEPVSGGAFRRYDDGTAELKRIWTAAAHRRRGHARRVLGALEDAVAAAGYRRIYLTTGPRHWRRSSCTSPRATPRSTTGPSIASCRTAPLREAPPEEPAVTATAVEPRSTAHDPPDSDLADLVITPARHPWRWVATAVVAVLVAMAVHALVTNPAWDWPTVGQYLFAPSILRAVWLTVVLTVLGIVIGFLLGTVLALMRLSPNPLLRGVSWSYIWIFRSVPLILQLLFWYNLALLYRSLSFGIPFGPALFEFETMDLVSPITAAVLGLALHQAAYAAEVKEDASRSIGVEAEHSANAPAISAPAPGSA